MENIYAGDPLCGGYIDDLEVLARKLERERNAWADVAKSRGQDAIRYHDERDKLLDAIRSYRDAKGRYHTQKACERLLKFLPRTASGHTSQPPK